MVTTIVLYIQCTQCTQCTHYTQCTHCTQCIHCTPCTVIAYCNTGYIEQSINLIRCASLSSIPRAIVCSRRSIVVCTKHSHVTLQHARRCITDD